jgi:hypothetical protein
MITARGAATGVDSGARTPAGAMRKAMGKRGGAALTAPPAQQGACAQ